MPTLNWLTREEDLTAAARVPYRLLEEVPELSCTEKDPATENMLIQGDNLEALKSLLPFYAGQVKCIFIDPPYNTKSAFGDFYDDNLEHSQWLAMMVPRLEVLREFLREDGSIWVTIDDNEAHYLKVVMDEVFGRRNFISSFAWEKDQGRRGDTDISSAHDHILAFAVNRDVWKGTRNLLPRTEAQTSRYRNPDRDPRGPWLQGDNGTAKSGGENSRFEIELPSGRKVKPPSGNYWRFSKESFELALKNNKVWFGKSGDSMPVIKRFLTEVQDGVVPRTWWPANEAGTNQSAKRDHLRKLLPEIEPFATPKPEQLLLLILRITTNPNDLVLDSFLGSGTSAAAAQKMNRRYIGIEMGEQAETHCVPRLRKVIEGEQGGISEAVGWQGGGGFRFYRLGKTVFDEDGQINPEIRFAQLAAHIWFSETRTPLGKKQPRVKLGVHDGTAYYLLYNGILGDKSVSGGNVLTRKVLAELPEHDGPKVIYGESSRLGEATLKRLGIVFKQTPYDVRAR
jgi:adenine-specific DNA-methyltransferase